MAANTSTGSQLTRPHGPVWLQGSGSGGPSASCRPGRTAHGLVRLGHHTHTHTHTQHTHHTHTTHTHTHMPPGLLAQLEFGAEPAAGRLPRPWLCFGSGRDLAGALAAVAPACRRLRRSPSAACVAGAAPAPRSLFGLHVYCQACSWPRRHSAAAPALAGVCPAAGTGSGCWVRWRRRRRRGLCACCGRGGGLSCRGALRRWRRPCPCRRCSCRSSACCCCRCPCGPRPRAAPCCPCFCSN